MTTDHRLFDLLHAVLPTRLPREQFYREFCAGYSKTDPSFRRAFKSFVTKRPELARKLLPGLVWFFGRTWRYNRIHKDPKSFLRDEAGLLNGPGAKAGLTWRDVEYLKGDEHDAEVSAAPATESVIKLRIPRRTWTDDLADARRAAEPMGGE